MSVTSFVPEIYVRVEKRTVFRLIARNNNLHTEQEIGEFDTEEEAQSKLDDLVARSLVKRNSPRWL